MNPSGWHEDMSRSSFRRARQARSTPTGLVSLPVDRQPVGKATLSAAELSVRVGPLELVQSVSLGGLAAMPTLRLNLCEHDPKEIRHSCPFGCGSGVGAGGLSGASLCTHHLSLKSRGQSGNHKDWAEPKSANDLLVETAELESRENVSCRQREETRNPTWVFRVCSSNTP